MSIPTRKIATLMSALLCIPIINFSTIAQDAGTQPVLSSARAILPTKYFRQTHGNSKYWRALLYSEQVISKKIRQK